ncbi:hypothetical protein TsFJ059_003822 [Trichoderma semiorbis]|uniref:Uncharacterized protein n=1 Tax=Trichoderma semiorbis TaxID=1491008 RepID=A0A9P8HPL2_9HYPO|nr:hypothetical protein TsFJ059_003822 [Trichoderma semiorbis]
MPANAEARRERLLRLSTAQEQASGTALNQAQTQTQTQEQAGQNDQAHNQPAIILYYERGVVMCFVFALALITTGSLAVALGVA